MVILRAIHYFDDYLSSLNSSADSPPPRYPKDSVRPALSAHFHLARLWEKLLVAGEETTEEGARTKMGNKVRSLHHFQSLVDYCERNPEAEELMAAELPLCREMARWER